MLSEKRYLIQSYVNLLWESLFTVAKLASDDARKAYCMLSSVTALLPVRIARRAHEVLRWTEEDEELVDELSERYNDVNQALSDVYFSKVLKGLRVVSEGLERMNLKWEISAIPVGVEEEGEEELLASEELEGDEGPELHNVEEGR